MRLEREEQDMRRCNRCLGPEPDEGGCGLANCPLGSLEAENYEDEYGNPCLWFQAK
jgi:hypothetical protein